MEPIPNPPNSYPATSLQSKRFFHSKRFTEAAQKLNPVLLWAAIAGLLTGLIGGSFRLLVSATLNHRVYWIHSLHSTPWLGAIVSLVLSGIMVYFGFWLMRRFAPDTSGSGIPQIEGLLEGYFPLVWQRVLPVKFVSGVSLLGAGMVLGREGPTIQMGGSIGSTIIKANNAIGWWWRSLHPTPKLGIRVLCCPYDVAGFLIARFLITGFIRVILCSSHSENIKSNRQQKGSEKKS